LADDVRAGLLRVEMMSMGASRFDIARFGRCSAVAAAIGPDDAGRVSNKMAPVIRQLWEQMPEPKWVIS
jgi:NADH-quinone oxidoreductase subunit B